MTEPFEKFLHKIPRLEEPIISYLAPEDVLSARNAAIPTGFKETNYGNVSSLWL